MKKLVLTLTVATFAVAATYAGDKACTDDCCAKMQTAAKTQTSAKDQCCMGQQAHKKNAKKELAGHPILKSPKALAS